MRCFPQVLENKGLRALTNPLGADRDQLDRTGDHFSVRSNLNDSRPYKTLLSSAGWLSMGLEFMGS